MLVMLPRAFPTSTVGVAPVGLAVECDFGRRHSKTLGGPVMHVHMCGGELRG